MSRVAVRRAIYGKLAADSTLTTMLGAAAPNYSQNIYYERAPSGANFPYVIFSRSTSNPTETLQNGSDAYKSDIWQVKGVDHSDSADVAENVADRCEALLRDATLSISGRNLMYLRPETEFDYSEEVEGETYRHAGSDYRLMHQP